MQDDATRFPDSSLGRLGANNFQKASESSDFFRETPAFYGGSMFSLLEYDRDYYVAI